jgi:hypothetical protein
MQSTTASCNHFQKSKPRTFDIAGVLSVPDPSGALLYNQGVTLPPRRARERALKGPSDRDKSKPALDESTFQQLLEAAYVLQEHSEQSPKTAVSAPPKAAPLDPLAEIVETQRLIHTGALDLQSACGLIAARAQKITHCTSALAGTIDEGQWTFRAVVGEASNEVGASVPIERTLAGRFSASGSTMQCPDVSKNAQLNADLCKSLGVRSFVTVTVAHEEKLAGFLELRYENVNGFSPQDVRTAELMAGLLREAIGRAAEQEWRHSLTTERTNMMQVLDALKPQLDRLAQPQKAPVPLEKLRLPVLDLPKVDEVTGVASEPPKIPPASVGAGRESVSNLTAETNSSREGAIPIDLEALLKDPFAPPTEAHAVTDVAANVGEKVETSGQEQWQPIAGSLCRGCGTPFTQEEFFCGGCGLALFAPEGFPEDASPKASLWHLHVQAEKEAAQAEAWGTDGPSGLDDPAVDALPDALQTLFEKFSSDEMRVDLGQGSESRIGGAPDVIAPKEQTALTIEATTVEALPGAGNASLEIPITPSWNSAAETQQWLESLPHAQKNSWLTDLWRTQKANVYLGAAVLLLLAVIAGLGSRPSQVGRSGQPSSSTSDDEQTQVQLTWFEKALVSFGLAEPPPPAPVYAGNPAIQVWEDLHTAIYYCPGSELYGKTSSGKFVPQRTAQQDQFEPANRKACD